MTIIQSCDSQTILDEASILNEATVQLETFIQTEADLENPQTNEGKDLKALIESSLQTITKITFSLMEPRRLLVKL